MNKLLLAVLFVLSLRAAVSTGVAMADDDSDIVSGCSMSNAEFGTEMIQICIAENNKARAELKAYPEQYQGLVDRCSRRKEMGWGVVKKCVDDDIASIPVIEAYARDHGALLDHCREEFRGREISRIRLCVEMALKERSPDATR